MLFLHIKDWPSIPSQKHEEEKEEGETCGNQLNGFISVCLD